MFKKMCVLYVNAVPVSRHIIKAKEYGEKGFYRDTVSMDAFTDRENANLNKNYLLNKPVAKRVDVRNYEQYVKTKKMTDEHLEKIGANKLVDKVDQTPIFEHENIKQFYEAIGYDIKKKKYI